MYFNGVQSKNTRPNPRAKLGWALCSLFASLYFWSSVVVAQDHAPELCRPEATYVMRIFRHEQPFRDLWVTCSKDGRSLQFLGERVFAVNAAHTEASFHWEGAPRGAFSFSKEKDGAEAVYRISNGYRVTLIEAVSPPEAPSSLPTPTRWYAPVAQLQRARIVARSGSWGAPRTKGRLHAGVDLHTSPEEKIFATAEGRVVLVTYPPKNKMTLFLEHRTADGHSLYSAYAHVGDVFVRMGENVTAKQLIARAMTRQEQKRATLRVNHLHFEIRNRISDFGTATISVRSRETLHRDFINPETHIF